MRRNKLNLIIDLATFAVLLGIVLTGILMRYVLPPGSRGGGCGIGFAGLTRHEWGDVHFWLSVGMGALIILHLAFHWNWVCVTISRLFTSKSPSTAQRNAYGVGAFLVISALLVGFVFAARSQVDLSEGGHGEGEGRQYRGGRGDSCEDPDACSESCEGEVPDECGGCDKTASGCRDAGDAEELPGTPKEGASVGKKGEEEGKGRRRRRGRQESGGESSSGCAEKDGCKSCPQN